MSSRFPVSDVPDPSAFQRVEQKLYTMYGGKPPPFAWSEDGEPVGCYTPLLYSQAMIDSSCDVAVALYNPDAVKPRPRELAVLALCSIWDVPYVRYCHIQGAAKVGLSQEQIEMALDGQIPDDLVESEKAAYRLGQTLAGSSSPLDDASWNDAATHLNRSEIVGIANVIGVYKWVSTLVQINDDHAKWRAAISK